MKLKILTAQKTEVGSMNLPKQFHESVRPDMIRRAVQSEQSHSRQKYGASPGAGQRHSAELSKRRRKYRGSYGFGISRIPRKILSRRGTRMSWVGAIIPGTVGGRRAHPPKAEKEWDLKMNAREHDKAMRSALAATLDTALVKARGHKPCNEYPFVVEDAFQDIDKSKDVLAALIKMGFGDELSRLKPTIRAGRGKMRGRKNLVPKGPLLVVSKDCALLRSAKNLAGFDVLGVDALDTSSLAPGTHAGRLTIFTKSALERLEKEALFTDERRMQLKAAVKHDERQSTKKPEATDSQPGSDNKSGSDKPVRKKQSVTKKQTKKSSKTQKKNIKVNDDGRG